MISVKINIFKDVFSEDYETLEYKRETSLSDLVEIGVLNGEARYLVSVNDEDCLYPDRADIPAFKDGDVVSVRLIPEGKNMGTFNYILGAAMILGGIGGIIASALMAPVLVGGIVMGSSAVLGGGSMIASQALSDAAPKPKGKGDLGKTYGFSSAKNEPRLGSPFPVVLGTHRMTPPIAAAYYTSLDNEEQGASDVYLNGLLCLGYGEIIPRDIKLGETLLPEEFDEYGNIELKLPDVKGTLQRVYGKVPPLYGGRKKEEILNVLLDPGMGRYTEEVRENATWVEGYYVPAGMVTDDNGNTFFRPGHWVHGRYEGGTIKEESRYDYPDAVRITRTVPAEVKTVRLQIMFAGGLYYYNGSSGRIDPATGGIHVEIPRIGDDPIKHDFSYVNAQNKQLRYTATLDVSEYKEDITIIISGLNGTADLPGDEYGSGMYAAATLVSIQYDYGDQPAVAPDVASKMTFLAFRIKANENTNGIMESLNCVASAKIPVFSSDNENTAEECSDPAAELSNFKDETSNPAAIALNILRGPYLSKPVSDDLIDLCAFKRLYKWCEKNEYECSAVLSESSTVIELINNILAAAHASFMMKGGKYSVAHDISQPGPLAIFSPKNTSGFSSHINTEELPAGAEVTFLDRKNGYKQTARKVFLKGREDAAGEIVPLEPFGVTSQEMAEKYALYLLACREYRGETFTITVPYYHSYLPVGSRVQLQHDTVRLGIASGRILAVDPESGDITVDEDLSALDPSKKYALKIAVGHGNIETISVSVIGGRVLKAKNPGDADESLKGRVYAFGEAGKETVECVIRNKKRVSTPEMSAVLELVNYDENIFRAVNEPIDPYKPEVTYQSKPVSEEIYIVPERPASAADKLIRRENDGSLTIGGVPPGMVTDIVSPAPIDYVEAEPLADASVRISWTATEDNAGGAGLAGYKIYRCSRPDKTDRAVVIMADKDCLSIVDPTPKRGAEVYYGVSAFDRNNNENAVTWASEIVTPTYVVGPAAPTDLKAAAAKGIISLTWKAPSNAGEVTYYEIEKAENGGEWSVIGQSGTLSFAEEIGRVERAVINSWLYRVRAYNLYEVYGPYSNETAANTEDYGTYIMADLKPALSPFINSVVISWEKQYELMDLKYVEIERYKAGALKPEATFQAASFYTDSGLKFDTNDLNQPVETDYKYRIRQVNEIGEAGPWSEAPVKVSPADQTILRVDRLEALKGNIHTITNSYIKGTPDDPELPIDQRRDKKDDLALTYVDFTTGRFRFGDLNAYIYGDGEKIAIKSLDMELNSSDLVTNADGIYLKHGGNSLTWGNAGFSTKYVSLSGSAAGINVDGKLSARSLEANAFRNNSDQNIADVNAWVRPGVYRVQGAVNVPPYENYGNVFVGASDTDTLFQLYSGLTNQGFYYRAGVFNFNDQRWNFTDWGRIIAGDINGNVGIRTESDSRYSLKASGESYFGGNMRVTGSLSSVRIGVNTDADTAYSLKVEGKSNLNGDLNIAGKAYANALGLGVQPDAVYALKVGGGGYFSGDIVASGKISSGGVPVMRAPAGNIFFKVSVNPVATYTVPAGEWLIIRAMKGVLNQVGFIGNWDMEVRRGGYVYEGWPYGSVFYLWKIGD